MILNQFKNQYQNNNQIIPILIENLVPFVKYSNYTEVWLKDAYIYLYPNDSFNSYSHNLNRKIQVANQYINILKECIQYCKQRYMVSKDIKYIQDIQDIEDNKMYVIKAIHSIEMAEYYDSKSI